LDKQFFTGIIYDVQILISAVEKNVKNPSTRYSAVLFICISEHDFTAVVNV